MFHSLIPIFLSLATVAKYYSLGDLNYGHVFLILLEAESLMITVQEHLVPREVNFLIHDIYSLCPCMIRKERLKYGCMVLSFSGQGTNFIHEDSTLMTQSPPKGPIHKYHHTRG